MAGVDSDSLPCQTFASMFPVTVFPATVPCPHVQKYFLSTTAQPGYPSHMLWRLMTSGSVSSYIIRSSNTFLPYRAASKCYSEMSVPPDRSTGAVF